MSDRRCLICEKRPITPTSKYGFCRICQSDVDKDTKERRERLNAWRKAERFLHWKGIIIGLYPTPRNTLRPERVFKDLKSLPKHKLLDLDVYCPGYTRDQIKRFKQAIIALAPELQRQKVVKIGQILQASHKYL